MTFYEWWNAGCRANEMQPHKFAHDFPSDAWLAKEAWFAALEYAKDKCQWCGKDGADLSHSFHKKCYEAMCCRSEY
jgi:hypothetical protein